MEDAISSIVADLENNPQAPISKQTLRNLQTLIDQQSPNVDDDGSDPYQIPTFWDELSSRSIPLSSIINPISAAIDSGHPHLSLLACKLYLSLILFPSSPTLSLFTPMAFLSLLHAIRRSFKNKKVSQSHPSDEQSDMAAGKGQKRRGKGMGRGNSKRVSDLEEDMEGGESEFDVGLLFSVLERLELVLRLVHLGRFPDSLRSLVQTVAQIPVLGIEPCNSPGNYKKLCDICSGILVKVINPEHGEMETTTAEVLKSLSPLVLLVKSQARTFAIAFVTRKMIEVAKNSVAVKKGIVNLPRYLAQKAPERSEARASAVESIMEIVKVMEFEDQLVFLDYAVKMTEGKANLRLLAVDLIPMLMMLLKKPSYMMSYEEAENQWKVRGLRVLIHRCSDAVAGIRARALSNLAQLISNMSSNENDIMVLKKAMAIEEGKSGREEVGMNDLIRKRCRDEKALVRKASLVLVTKWMTLGDGLDREVLKMIGMACSDPLVSIRKAALSALSQERYVSTLETFLATLRFPAIIEKTLEENPSALSFLHGNMDSGICPLGEQARYLELIIRLNIKAFRTFSDRSVIIEWLHSVPRLITDNETSIQEECENLFLELVLDRISMASTGRSSTQPVICNSNLSRDNFNKKLEMLFPCGVLELLREISNSEVMPWIKKICSRLGKKKRMKHRLATAVQDIIRTSERTWLCHSLPIEKWMAPPGAWFILSEVSLFLPKAINWEFLHHHWQLLDNCGHRSEILSSIHGVGFKGVESMESDSVAWANDRVLLLQTISKVSVELPAEPAADLAHSLLKRLEEFDMHLTEVNAHVQALRTLCRRKAMNSDEADTLVRRWVDLLLGKALHIIQKFLSEEPEVNKERMFFTPLRSGCKTARTQAPISRSLSQAITAAYTIGAAVIVCPSINLKDIIPVLHGIITSGSKEMRVNNLPGSTISIKQKSPSLFIQSWLTMGKICLADGNLAKSYIPLFVQGLENDCAALRNNIIVIMADFCVRYTALIDCYIAKITKCLRDPCELVRRQTFILLSRLLQTDYVKWRGVLFLRFLLSLVDESEKVRQLADFLFGSILKVKAPLLAYNSFVEAVFVLNDCHTHMGQNNSQTSRSENQLFSIKGNDEGSRSKRMHIYVSLLKQMAPEHLLATFAKICAEILAAASDGMLTIEDATGQAVLQDAFQILICKEIRIPTNRGPASDAGDADEEGGDGAGASAAAARGRFITQAVKKSLIQNTIPIFIELKRLLESKNSPLIGSLMECLRVILKDYKNEIEDFLVADKQLQKELLYDMQKYEAAKAKSTATEAAAAMQRSAAFLSPGAPRAAAIGHNVPKNIQNDPKVASAMADVAAASKVRSVLQQVNLGISTPPLSSMSVPRLKSSGRIVAAPGGAGGEGLSDILESVRRRQSFSSDGEN